MTSTIHVRDGGAASAAVSDASRKDNAAKKDSEHDIALAQAAAATAAATAADVAFVCSGRSEVCNIRELWFFSACRVAVLDLLKKMIR
jgi:hypothetical protein